MFKNKMLWNPENIDEYREPLQQPVIVEKLRNLIVSELFWTVMRPLTALR